MQKRLVNSSVKEVFTFLLIISSFLLGLSPRVQAHSGDIVHSGWAGIPPTIDGMLAPGEWNSPVVSKTLEYFNTNTSVNELHLMEVRILNDDQNLYLAITIYDEDYVLDTFWHTDVIEVYFDDDNDGIVETNDDIYNFFNFNFGDWHFVSSGWSSDLIKNGIGVATHSNLALGNYVFEFKIPLNSGDVQDISVLAGDTMGIKIMYREMYFKQGAYYWAGEDGWPSNAAHTDGETYGDLILATEQLSTVLTTEITSGKSSTTVMSNETTSQTTSEKASTGTSTTKSISIPSLSPGFTLICSIIGIIGFKLWGKRHRKPDKNTHD